MKTVRKRNKEEIKEGRTKKKTIRKRKKEEIQKEGRIIIIKKTNKTKV